MASVLILVVLFLKAYGQGVVISNLALLNGQQYRNVRVQRIDGPDDGTYSFVVPGGKHLLYARYESDYSVVEWALPLNLLNETETKMDLHNDTAVVIHNKQD